MAKKLFSRWIEPAWMGLISSVRALGLPLLAGWVALGTFRALTHGAHDFAVFYGSWRLVLEGRGSEIYRVSTDRFLYAPGFAWLLSPLGLLPQKVCLWVWCLLKAGVVGFLVKKLGHVQPPFGTRSRGQRGFFEVNGWAAWGVMMVARPLLIDFEYGQVNLFILGACVWALVGHFERRSSLVWDSLRWGVMTFAALAKLFPLPLLLVPWFVTQGISPVKLKQERRAIVLGALWVVGIPFLGQNLEAAFQLLVDWRSSLLARGLPLETHNQSFTALLYHYLSGAGTPIHSEGGGPLFLGFRVLSLAQIELLSLSWFFVTQGLLLGWVIAGSKHAPMKWVAVVIGLLILPSHLIWKPYFVMSIPLAVFVIQGQWKLWQRTILIVGLFAGINLTGFDFLGHLWAAHIEAASFLLFIHVALIALALVAVERQSFTVRDDYLAHSLDL